jgi:hypothetical protein
VSPALLWASKMNDLRIWVENARSIILEDSAARTVDFLYARYADFDDVFRDIEERLATRPIEIGIRGVVSNDLDLGHYLHISDKAPPISLLFRYDEDHVYVENVAIENQVSYKLAS